MTEEAINREQWLERAVTMLSGIIEETELLSVPADVRVSVGWPSSRGLNGKVIGQCWNATASDGVAQMFISPILKDPIEVLATLLHELVHAADDCEHGHKGVFTRTIRAIGLAGKPTETYAEEGTELYEHLAVIAKTLGDYPHRGIKPGAGGPKKQTTRMIKCSCDECGYTVRTTQKWIDVAVPTCPDEDCGNAGLPMTVEEK